MLTISKKCATVFLAPSKRQGLFENSKPNEKEKAVMPRKKFLLISYTNPPTRTLAVMKQYNIPAEAILVKYATHNLEAHEILHREGYLVEYIIFDLTEFPPRSISIVPIIWNMWHELRKKVMFLFPEEESIPAVIWRELHKAGLPQEFDIKKFLSHRKDKRKFAEAA